MKRHRSDTEKKENTKKIARKKNLNLRSKYWSGGMILKNMPKEVQGVILNIWLPLHWGDIWKESLRSLEKKGYFEKEVYIRRLKSKDTWFVDYADMAEEKQDFIDRPNTTVKRRYLLKSTPLEGYIFLLHYPNQILQDGFSTHPGDFPVEVLLNPRKKINGEPDRSTFKAVYLYPTSAVWKGIREKSGNRVLRYEIEQLDVGKSVVIEFDEDTQTHRFNHRKMVHTLDIS